MDVECDRCGKVFNRRPSVINEKQNFCSRKCFQKGTGVTYTCDYCGNQNTKSECRFNENQKNYCNRECMIKDRENNVTKKCEQCGDEFTFPESKSEKFCSRECYSQYRSEVIVGENHPQWLEETRYYYGKNWEKLREKARKRDDYKCVVCGKTKEETNDGKQPHIHHIQPIRTFENPEQANKLSNLVALCPEHHVKYEGQTDITVKELKQKNE